MTTRDTINNRLENEEEEEESIIPMRSRTINMPMLSDKRKQFNMFCPRSIQRGKMKSIVLIMSAIIVSSISIEAFTTISPQKLQQQQQQQQLQTSTLTPTTQANELNRQQTETEVTLAQQESLVTKFSQDHVEQTTTTQRQPREQTAQPQQQAEVVAAGGGLLQQQTPSATKTVPVLRPSIEEVASQLSRKHLNLEHENWRLKAAATTTTTTPLSSLIDQYQLDSMSTAGDDTAATVGGGIVGTTIAATDNVGHGGSSLAETEQEIQQQVSWQQQAGANSTITRQHPQESSSASAATLKKLTDHYLNTDMASGGVNQARKQQHPSAANGRSKKMGYLLQQSYYEDNELFQCHQYLQFHSSPQVSSSPPQASFSPLPAINAGLSRLLSSQLLPCSCEARDQQAGGDATQQEIPSISSEASTWLSCDNVQLMGSHFYTQQPQPNGPSNASDGNTHQRQQQQNFPSLMVTRFSQRDSGLQTLHAQKFHYLQLFHLKSIDLSNNRIRQIKMDAFHGLENELEYLNLANNLLGDLRALTNEKLIFLSDELNRLKKLKWLSLHNNQIKQLGPTIFYKPAAAATTSSTSTSSNANTNADSLNINNNNNNNNNNELILSELSYLDLSENLLNFIPSDSIYQLNELKILKLARNRITELNQFSRFPKSLKYLDLSENLIKTIRQCNLIDLPNLIELNLSHNQLSHLDKTAFVPSTSSLLSTNNLVLTPTSESGSSSVNNVEHRQSNDLSPGPDPKSHLAPDDNVKSAAVRSSQPRSKRNAEDLRELEAIAGGGYTGDDDDSPREGRGLDEGDADDMDVEESSISLMTASQAARRKQTVGDDSAVNSIQQLEQFNSTLRLNLSYNLFEKIPGDSLLKFTNLQQLDLSSNRIRKLDSNYLCSIYNLVENLRHLDLSGNLLSIMASQNSSTNLPSDIAGNGKHLNRLFGCLQRLEKLILSTNRLTATTVAVEHRQTGFRHQQASSSMESPVSNLQEDYDSDPLGAESSNVNEQTATSGSSDRLTIKFGEGFGSRFLNTLDLSDNQLDQMPIIEQITQNPIVSLNVTTSDAVNLSYHQSNLNRWINSRLYLEILNLNYNSIERLEEQDFEYLFNLRHLYLDFNKLSHLPIKLMRQFTSLDRLSLNGNMINRISPLNELFERSTKTLRLLNLANNRLTEWPQITKLVQPDSSSGQQQFSGAASANNFDDFPASQATVGFALEELNLEGNQFTSENITSLFDQLLYMKSLRVLNLNYNQLNRVKSEWFKFANRNLQSLMLTGNRINNIDLGSFAWNQVNQLAELNLDFNLLRELRRKTFDSLPKLRQLNLGNNLIHTINSETFHRVNSLQILKLNNNKLTSWKCEYFANLCNPTSGAINADLASILGVKSLQNQQAPSQENPNPSTVSSLLELDLSHNSLSQLRSNSIAVHTKLVKLNLSHNKLSFIPHDLFKVTTSGQLTGRQILLVSSIKYLNLAHNHIQTIDNINFRPLRNLLSLDLSYNELQTLGLDVILMDPKSIQQHEQNTRKIIISNLTSLPLDEQLFSSSTTNGSHASASNEKLKSSSSNRAGRFMPPATNWPSLSKLRHLNVANNQLTLVNQSLISELSPFALLNLNLSFNYLDSESLPYGFYTKITSTSKNIATSGGSSSSVNNNFNGNDPDSTTKALQNYDLVFTLKLESLDLSHNKLHEFPTNLLDNHYTSMESCNLAHNRIQNLAANSNLMVQIKSLNLEFNPLNRESNELVLFEQRSVRSLNMAATRLYAIQQATLESDQLPSAISAANPKVKFRLVNQASQLDLIRSISRPIDAPYLRHLNLSSNQLVWLASSVFDRMHSLQTLDLSNNHLTRLHLINNQLIHVSSSLEYLNMASNLFTSIDFNDFNQLTRLRHLDLSNLLSLQKMNCKFLNKLGTLKTLKMFNYPQLRQNMNNMLKLLTNNTATIGPDVQDLRFKQKLMNDLISTSMGRHCFQEEPYSLNGHDEQQPQQAPNSINTIWFNLEQLELELFNNFWDQKEQLTIESDNGNGKGGGFKLRDELSQLLGPQLKRLSLFGLNLTSLSDDSLFGITSDELRLKISYTSLSRLPLRQLLSSLAKRTKLNLDFRNNNIQSIDTRSLQLLDELQLNSQVLQRSDHSSLRLASNPIRCDCQTRPLWLWLNQRWSATADPTATTLSAATTDDGPLVVGEIPTGGSQNYWHPRLKSVASYTSDLKCYYPLKLRGKSTQNVYYNELVCKGNQQQISPKKGNETRSSGGDGSYYLTSASDTSFGDSDDTLNHDGDNDDYLDLAESARVDSVRMTKFNRYPTNYENRTSQLWNSVNIPPATAQEQPADDYYPTMARDSSLSATKPQEDGWNRKDRRASSSIEYAADSGGQIINPNQHHQQFNTNYNKHKPNIHQRHSHYDTVSSFNSHPSTVVSLSGKSAYQLKSHHQSNSARHSLLTDIDVIILAVSSIAMTIMSFIIIIICVFKYKMDQDGQGKEQILLDPQSQAAFIASQAAAAAMLMHNNKKMKQNVEPPPPPCGMKHLESHSAQTSSTDSKSSGAELYPARKKLNHGGQVRHGHGNLSNNLLIEQTVASNQHKVNANKQQHRNNQVLVSMGPNGPQSGMIAPPTSENFLMRSPTIRRMHGFAANASDWFKFTLRAYPPNGRSNNNAPNNQHQRQRRNHLFMGKKLPVGGSQLTTAQFVNLSSIHLDRKSKPVPSALCSAGCPVHAFKSLQRLQQVAATGHKANLQQQEELHCQHCSRLLAAVERAKISYLADTTAEQSPEETSSSNITQMDPTKRSLWESEKQGADRKSLAKTNGDNNIAGDEVASKMTKQVDQLEQQQQQQQQQQHQHQQEPSSNQRRSTNSMVYNNCREQRNRPLRTFGSKAPSSSSFKITQSMDGRQQQAANPNGQQIQSQLPGAEIEGRFAYQSDSNFDSPACNVDSNQGSRVNTMVGGERSSSIVGDREQMFILVHDGDSPTVSNGTKTVESASIDRHRRGPRLSDNVGESNSSMMNDECSQSSSPVAYGFMRSSPSATTLSSVTTAQNNCTLPQQNHIPNSYQLINDTSHNSTNDGYNNNNNNDNTGYWVHKKTTRDAAPHPPAPKLATATTTTTTKTMTTDDQIIISRL